MKKIVNQERHFLVEVSPKNENNWCVATNKTFDSIKEAKRWYGETTWKNLPHYEKRIVTREITDTVAEVL